MCCTPCLLSLILLLLLLLLLLLFLVDIRLPSCWYFLPMMVPWTVLVTHRCDCVVDFVACVMRRPPSQIGKWPWHSPQVLAVVTFESHPNSHGYLPSRCCWWGSICYNVHGGRFSSCSGNIFKKDKIRWMQIWILRRLVPQGSTGGQHGPPRRDSSAETQSRDAALGYVR